MTKKEAIDLIDSHKNESDPVEMLNWIWLRVIILNIDDYSWKEALIKAAKTLSK